MTEHPYPGMNRDDIIRHLESRVQELEGERDEALARWDKAGADLTLEVKARVAAESHLARLEEVAQKVVDAQRAVVEAVTPGHANWLGPDDQEEFHARFSHWHSTTRELRSALTHSPDPAQPDPGSRR